MLLVNCHFVKMRLPSALDLQHCLFLLALIFGAGVLLNMPVVVGEKTGRQLVGLPVVRTEHKGASVPSLRGMEGLTGLS